MSRSCVFVALPLVAVLTGLAAADPRPQAPIPAPNEIEDLDEAMAPPAGYTPVERTRKGFVVGGALSLVGVYAVGAALAVLDQQDLGCCAHNRLWPLWIPIAGPFIELGTVRGFSVDANEARVALLFGGAAQIASVVMMYVGVTRKETVYVRNDRLGNLTLTPIGGNGASGLALAGSF